MATNDSPHPLSFPPIITAVVCVAALYFARSVLIPLALAILLAFLLGPLVNWMERCHLGRTGPVVLSVLLAICLLGGIGWVVFDQAMNLATQLPEYQATISKKIEAIRGVRSKKLDEAAATVKALGNELSSKMATNLPPPAEVKETPRRKLSETPVATAEHPLPVEIVPRHDAISSLRSFAGPLITPMFTILIVVVFTAFILLRREDLRSRLFALTGLNRIHLTTQAFDEATQRVGRFLLIQSFVNMTYGALFGTVLYFVGVPHALLWGVLSAVLKFIPYVGNLIGAGMPILLSFAVFGGWERPLIVVGAFLVIEITTTYFIEPLLYGSQTGVSSLAILVAAIFWAALWGPVGLLLSTPLTVCIVVVGHYIPQLEFLSVLLGDKGALAPEVQLYQNLLNNDRDGVKRILDAYRKEKSITDLYDCVLLPVLTFVEKDSRNAALGDSRERYVLGALKDLVEELSLEKGDASGGQSKPEPAPAALPHDKLNVSIIGISCVPARGEADEIAGIMLGDLLSRAGYDTHVIAPGSLDDMIEELSEQASNIIYISALPPFSISHLRRLGKKLHNRFPKSRMGFGLWGFSSDNYTMRTRLGMSEADLLAATFSGAVTQTPLLLEAVAQ
ncbi:MAG: AI-2E family transporter [Candidatus Acidiferrales bacterium]